MRTTRGMAIAAVSALAASGAVVGVTGAAASPTATDVSDSTATLRFATFNAILNRERPGPAPPPTCPHRPTRRPRTIAEIIQRTRPDVLLINEFDFDVAARAATFPDNYLSVGQNGARPIHYPYRVHRAVSNTGIAAGFDLNNDGRVITPGAPDTATTRSASVHSPASSAWPCTRATPSTPTVSAPSSGSCGRTCPARCCRTTRPPRRRPTGTPPRSSPSSGCRRKSHWDLPSRSADRTVHFLVSATRPRRSSTGRRTATGGATSTRSGSGPTT